MTTDITELAQRARINAECGEHLSPAETIDLVEALEKAHSARDEYEAGERSAAVKSVALQDEIYRLNARIADLESRTVNIKFAPIQVEELGNVRDGKKHPYMFGAGYNSAVIRCESVIKQELDAKGIKWEGE